MANSVKTELPQGATQAKSAAYVPFRTLMSAIEALELGVPKKLDRTIWRSQSGVTQSQILMALRFLNLVDEEDRPTALLQEFVSDKDQRKLTMGLVLNSAYGEVLKHDLTKMTPKMLDDAFDGLGVVGDTKRKAVTFFLKAAKYAEISMHPLLAAQVRNTGPRKKRNGIKRAANQSAILVSPTTSSGVQSTNTKSIRLRNGGVVTLAMAYDPFSLGQSDREFVFGLVDALNEYEGHNPPAEDQEDEEEP